MKTDFELKQDLNRLYNLMYAGHEALALAAFKELLLTEAKTFKNIGGCCGGCK